jgi:hypothetical protein
MQVVLPLPPDLNQKFQGMALANESLMLARQYEKARRGFEEIYELLCREQPRDDRYHKGYPLHQIGTTFVLSGKPQDALLYFILAYAEDLLSQEEGQEDKADEMPASRTLRQAYKVDEGALSELKHIIKQKKKHGYIVHNPQDILNELAKGQRPEEVTKPAQSPQIGVEKRKPGQFDSDWQRRVFVGGNYRDQLAILNEIKVFVKSIGYDPVLALDFEIPRGMTHHHSLMLLHECSKAIFEISSEAGQLMEIERLIDYEIKPLIVYQSSAAGEPPKVTEMLRALLASRGFEPRPYITIEELKGSIQNYLSPTVS